ncbi:hypothetical protein [Flavobacterium nitrogenifigens]|uniref:YD repeat-containing protein n=1 Tax=Flavobacterium nitrogenifigens TaxID=1617283 RepID=A0A521D6E0_9FLAO|nr:hypothetical protein [Flavobacterium nitrogenifigens]KAF2332657.1 hypothetical protein DM397_10100 [Flavobacterium nitrogenifigens]SMO66440.1 hypothetical protein SAMN06265220_1021022 [Flavobacterium nitrogenifigens]
MKRKLLKLLLVFTILFQLTMISCSSDEAPVDPEVVVPVDPKPVDPKPVLPKSEMMKPAIVNISFSKTSKSSETRKRLIRSTKFAQNYMGKIYQYKLDRDAAIYKDLPSENLYDTVETALNIKTERDYELVYKYNNLGQLIKIEADKVYTNNGNTNTPEVFSFTYNENGSLNEMISSYAYGSSYTYNSKGLIDKRIEKDGFVSYKYFYDEQDRILDVYFYIHDALQMHYKYTYPDDKTYIKGWYSVNVDQTETLTSYVVYAFDPAKAGVYNKEPYYRLDNQYLHVTKISASILSNGTWQVQFEVVPKYFYDEEGYLIKYDAAGLNYTTDITVFEYE